MTDIEQPRWAALIEQKRKEMRPSLSARKAADRAGLSEGRWRQIVKGYQSTGGGRIPVVGPAETVARMAQVVGLSPDELAEAGRPDAADELRRAIAEFPNTPDWAEKTLDMQAMWAELNAYMEASDEEWVERPPTNALMLWSTEQLLEVLTARVKGLLEHDKRMTQRIIVRGQAIDTLRAELGLEPLYSHLESSGFNTPEAVAEAGGIVKRSGGDGNVEDTRDSAPTSQEYDLAAHDEAHSIESEQGHDETP